MILCVCGACGVCLFVAYHAILNIEWGIEYLVCGEGI